VWTDSSWLERRARLEERPVNIYEIHIGSFGKNPDGTFKNYREIAKDLGNWAGSAHFTHVEMLGLLEHPADCSWGYQVSGFFSPTKGHGSFEDFQYMVNHLHEKNIGVIIDFVPYHFAPDEWALREYGGLKFFESAETYNGESPSGEPAYLTWRGKMCATFYFPAPISF
jgi:1,4-alpha-glucan branching enzyme